LYFRFSLRVVLLVLVNNRSGVFFKKKKWKMGIGLERRRRQARREGGSVAGLPHTLVELVALGGLGS
jgi:hypothetical protein